jgi:hypothetical protein
MADPAEFNTATDLDYFKIFFAARYDGLLPGGLALNPRMNNPLAGSSTSYEGPQFTHQHNLPILAQKQLGVHPIVLQAM